MTKMTQVTQKAPKRNALHAYLPTYDQGVDGATNPLAGPLLSAPMRVIRAAFAGYSAARFLTEMQVREVV